MNFAEEKINLLDERVSYYNYLFKQTFFSKINLFFRHPIKALLRKIILLFFRKSPILVRTKTFWGDNMNIFSYENTLWFCGFLSSATEINLTKYFLKNIKDGDVFFDVGAHHGFYSLLVKNILKDRGHIYSFEPSPIHFSILKNNLYNKNIVLNNTALYSESCKLTFYENIKGTSTINKDFFKIKKTFDKKSFKEIVVPSVTMDYYCRKNNVFPTVIKIDTEGSEYDILVGANFVLESFSPVILMEVWDSSYNNENHLKAVKFLINKGYSMYEICDDLSEVKIGGYHLDNHLLNLKGINNFLFKK